MPIFEYNCCDCGHGFETIVRSTKEKVCCPQCRSGSVKKQLSVFSSPVSKESTTASSGCACTPQNCGCH